MILNIVCFAAAAAALIIPTKHALHMFQQNRYETGRYSGWVRENWKDGVPGSILPIGLVLLMAVLSFFHLPALLFAAGLVLLALYHFAMEKGKTYIKPLVITSRVRRQIAVTVLVDAAVMVLFLSLVPASFCYGILAVFAMAGAWIMIYPMAWITAPIEHSVQKWYLNDAKKILKDHSGLIRIGITGSYGKTTTKNIMQAMLSEEFNSLMTPASFNTPMGITRTIREMLKPIHQVFVCEMGADHVGDITELMDFVHPGIGVVTSVGPQHLNTFGSQENILREKMQMIEKLPPDGFGILNYDNNLIRGYSIKNHVAVATYGIRSTDVDYRAKDIVYGNSGSSFTVVCSEGEFPMETRLLGELNILNILSAVACARHLGVSWQSISRACRSMKQVEHRLELKKINGLRFIDDAFNANPSGSRMALEVLSHMKGTRYIVTPGMIDLGEKQDEINRAFGGMMKGRADRVILVGAVQTKPIYEGLEKSGFDMKNVVVLNREREAFAYIWQNAAAEDIILLENDLPDAFNH